MITNDYNLKGNGFLNAIRLLVDEGEQKDCDVVFDTLDQISLKSGRHLGLKLAEEAGIGDESAFYIFTGNPKPRGQECCGRFPQSDCKRLFGQLVVRPSVMGTWQLYLLFIAPTVLPAFWHGNYIRRTYFFDLSYQEAYLDVETMFGEEVRMRTASIPLPTVESNAGKYIIRCAYWNDWQGLMLETFKCAIGEDGSAKIYKPTARTLCRYNCGVLF